MIVNLLSLKRYIFAALAALFLCFSPPAFSGSDLDVNPKNIESIYNKLLSVVTKPENTSWPPSLEISKENVINAFAQRVTENIYKVTISEKLMRTCCQNNDNGIAFILAHELAHIAMKHKVQDIYGKLIVLANQRSDEFEADSLGLKYALRAGFSFRAIIGTINNLRDSCGDYSSIEALSVNHPSWTERLAKIDKEQAALWKSMAAFQNGIFFLELSNYKAAATCFKSITKDVPACYEAWNNLGYTYLMQYLADFTLEEFKSYNVGRLEFRNFYRTPLTLETNLRKIRGVNEELWLDATNALNEATRLNEKLSLGYQNLGIAYLFHPSGKDLGQARVYFEKSIGLIEADKQLDLFSLFSIYINYAALNFEIDTVKSNQLLLAMQRIIEKSRTGDNRELVSELTEELSNTKRFNTILLSSNNPVNLRMVSDIEYYLSYEDCNSIWWEIACDIYKNHCIKINKPIIGKPAFCKPRIEGRYLQMTSVSLSDSVDLYLTASISNVLKILNPKDYSKITLAKKYNLYEYRLKKGIRLIGGDDIIAIFLDSLSSPFVTLKENSLSGEKYRIFIGMTLEQYNTILKEEADKYIYTFFLDEDLKYKYYKNLGLAIQVKEGKIVEIALLPKFQNTTY